VKPRMGGSSIKGGAQSRSGAAPTQPGSEPLRTGRTVTGAPATPTVAE
jgi:biopolymer transport protein ExbB